MDNILDQSLKDREEKKLVDFISNERLRVLVGTKLFQEKLYQLLKKEFDKKEGVEAIGSDGQISEEGLAWLKSFLSKIECTYESKVKHIVFNTLDEEARFGFVHDMDISWQEEDGCSANKKKDFVLSREEKKLYVAQRKCVSVMASLGKLINKNRKDSYKKFAVYMLLAIAAFIASGILSGGAISMLFATVLFSGGVVEIIKATYNTYKENTEKEDKLTTIEKQLDNSLSKLLSLMSIEEEHIDSKRTLLPKLITLELALREIQTEGVSYEQETRSDGRTALLATNLQLTEPVAAALMQVINKNITSLHDLMSSKTSLSTSDSALLLDISKELEGIESKDVNSVVRILQEAEHSIAQIIGRVEVSDQKKITSAISSF